MTPDNEDLLMLRHLLLKSRYEPLDESETAKLNQIMKSEAGSKEAALLMNQLTAFSDETSLDSPLVLAELIGAISDRSDHEMPTQQASVTTSKTVCATPPIDVAHSNQRSNFPWLLTLVASNLLVAALAWSLAKSLSTEYRRNEIALDSAPTLDSDSSPIGSASPQLVSMTACVWRPSSDPTPMIGESLESGDSLNLVEGIAELRIGDVTSGEALARIEGPASLYIRSDGQLDLLQGSMTIKSLSTGRGRVKVHTPVGHVLADGLSSLGLVSSDSECEVHLFSGRAIVETYLDESGKTEMPVETGEAVRITAQSEGDHVIVRFEASENNFVSGRSLAFDSLEIGDEYVRSVLDSQPKVYWRFEETRGEHPRYIENLGSAEGINAVVVGEPGWRQYGENRVAELGMSQSSAFRGLTSWSDKPLDDYTIEIWVKPLTFHHGEVICLHDTEPLNDGRYQHAMMLETTAQHYFTHRLSDSPSNRFRFVHRPLGAAQPISATSLFASQPYRPRIWQHVAVQKQGNLQRMWIDGQLSGERENTAPLDNDVQILIGQVYPDTIDRRFVGQIDEVAIYDRCLPPQELRKHIIAAGRSVAENAAD